MNVRHIATTQEAPFSEKAVQPCESGAAGLCLSGEEKQTFHGFGGCFNEISWQLINALPEDKKQALLDEFFTLAGCNFSFGRVPIGANDFSLEWYSCDEVKGDFALEHFNIERDKQYTLPFVRAAQQRREKDFFLFGSPWSPPTWMKTIPVYNNGRMRMEPEYLTAYAEYFVRFVKAYAEEGVAVRQVHVQNEPMADQKFPSCLWSGEDMLVFIRDYLGPALEKSGLDTELWLGTINGPFTGMLMVEKDLEWYFDRFANRVLSDDTARGYISGVGLQWGGKNILQQLQAAWPEVRIMQTESECGDGQNSWEHMEYVFGFLWSYLVNGAERFTYWNFALDGAASSTWGWPQNSLTTIEGGEVRFNPEFYLMKHFSHFVQPGARVLGVQGPWAANALCFQNPDGGHVLVVCNAMHQPRTLRFEAEGTAFEAEIPAHSLHTFTW